MAAKIKKINLALQGGGAHGAFAWGVIDELLRDDRIEIDSISATSAGAMNAVAIAQGYLNNGKAGARETLHKFWREISDFGKLFSPIKITPWESFLGINPESSASYFMFNLMTKIFSPYQFNPFNYNPIHELLDSLINFDHIKSKDAIKLFICATNVKTGKVKIFNNQELCTKAILASSCLPDLFQAVGIEGEFYWDGGYMGNPAIFPLIYESTVNDVLIIHINPIVRESVPHTASEIMNRINEVSFNSSLMREMRAIAFVTKLLDDHWIKEEYYDRVKRMYIHSIRSDEIMRKFSVASKFNTDWDFLMQLFKLGNEAGVNWLKHHYDKIGNQSSIEIAEFL